MALAVVGRALNTTVSHSAIWTTMAMCTSSHRTAMITTSITNIRAQRAVEKAIQALCALPCVTVTKLMECMIVGTSTWAIITPAWKLLMFLWFKWIDRSPTRSTWYLYHPPALSAANYLLLRVNPRQLVSPLS